MVVVVVGDLKGEVEVLVEVEVEVVAVVVVVIVVVEVSLMSTGKGMRAQHVVWAAHADSLYLLIYKLYR